MTLVTSKVAHSSSNDLRHISLPNTKIVRVWIKFSIDESLHCIRYHPHYSVSVDLETDNSVNKLVIAGFRKVSPVETKVSICAILKNALWWM